MFQDILVLGAGIAGLTTALGVARAGKRVTLVDRDPPPASWDPEVAFMAWARRSVPQARQPHAFWARSRNLLLENVPDVVERLHAWGVGETNLIDLAPPELRLSSDDQFAMLAVRRLPFEIILRKAVADEPNVLFEHGVVDGLEFGDSANGHPPTIVGVRLRGGRSLRAEVVVDGLGRRSPVPGLLALRGIVVPTEVEDCNMIYYGRYYRQREDSSLDPLALSRGGIGLEYIAIAPFRSDHRTFGAFICPPSWDESFRSLRHNDVWEAVARCVPLLAPWMDRDHAVPIADVQAMAGHQNVLRHFVCDARPVVRGLLPVGDSLCTTNPMSGWGASLAVTMSFAAVRAVAENTGLDDVALGYASEVMPEAEIYYGASAAQDRIRTCRWRGQDVAAEDRAEAERQDLLVRGFGPAMRRDMYVLRAMLRRMMLIDPPDAIWSDEKAVAVAREVAAWRAVHRPPSSVRPSPDEVLHVIAEAEARRQSAISGHAEAS